jgi:hypothetical protein
MAYTWMTDLTDFLDDDGDIITEPAKSKELAEFFTDIVFMSSFPNKDIPPEYSVKCHSHPDHEACLGEIVGFINQETDAIMWMCPKCVERGFINNWRGTMWDLSNLSSITN